MAGSHFILFKFHPQLQQDQSNQSWRYPKKGCPAIWIGIQIHHPSPLEWGVEVVIWKSLQK
jgi:hypothetical protein